MTPVKQRFWVDAFGNLYRMVPFGTGFIAEWFLGPTLDTLSWFPLENIDHADLECVYQGATAEEIANRHGWEEWTPEQVMVAFSRAYIKKEQATKEWLVARDVEVLRLA